MSEFAKDPKKIGQLQDDLNQVKSYFANLQTILPNTRKFLTKGTHEYRWEKYLQKHAPEVAGLDALTIEELFELKDYDIECIDYEKGILINGVFLVLHGDIVSTESAYTARRHLDSKGGSGICNHTHRLGSCYKRDRYGIRGWWENGCLCTLNPDWITNPNWQQGFSLVHFTTAGRFWVEQLPIINGELMYGGKLWS